MINERTYKLIIDDKIEVSGTFRDIQEALTAAEYDTSHDGLNKRFGNNKEGWLTQKRTFRT